MDTSYLAVPEPLAHANFFVLYRFGLFFNIGYRILQLTEVHEHDLIHEIPVHITLECVLCFIFYQNLSWRLLTLGTNI
jgi:hypothetical protein